MASPIARPAPRTFIPVTNGSDELRAKLSDTGLSERALAGPTTRLTHDLRVAGAGALRPERRNDLALHLRYWTAVRRILRYDRSGAPRIEDYDPEIRTLQALELFDAATNGAGVSQYEITEFHIAGTPDQFIVDGCRLVKGTVDGLHVTELLSLQETGIFHTHILDTQVPTFNAPFCSVSSSMINVTSEVFECFEGLMRDTDITLRVSERASFDAANLGTDDEGSKTLVDNLKGLATWRDNHAPVRFRDCQFAAASFRGAQLDGVSFARCAFGDLDVSGASFKRTTKFTECELRGRPLTLADLDKGDYDRDRPPTVG